MWQAAKSCKNFAQFNSSSFCESRLSRACPSCFQMNVVQSLILTSCFVVTAGDIFQVDSIPPLFLSCGAFEYQWPMCRRGFPCSDSPNSNLEYQCSWPELSRFHCSCFSFSFSHKKSKWHDWCGKSLDMRIEAREVEESGRELNWRGGKSCSSRGSKQRVEGAQRSKGIWEFHVLVKTGGSYQRKELPMPAKSDKLSLQREFWNNSYPSSSSHWPLSFLLIRALWPHNNYWIATK